jgi:ATP-dependent exoDNAse (exonuclease V) beta subunit
MLNDSAQRAQAIDPACSYIVQAPAGSGKTEILTQRYLKLLSRVKAPEQIIALTFTRKAANEMRERILLALQQAAANVEGSSAHQKQTLSFAKQALERDKMLSWQLTEQPSRLRILTIDALCQFLTKAIPLHEKQTPYAQISDMPNHYYRTAARACIDFAIETEAYHAALKTLLHHVDNRQDVLLSLFTELLAKRSQWLQLIYQAKAQDKKSYEKALAWIIKHDIKRFRQTLPEEDTKELIRLTRKLSLIENDRNSPRYVLREWQFFEELEKGLEGSESQGLSGIDIINGLVALLLTSQNTLRKSFDHHVGLRKDHCEKSVYDELKNLSKDLLTRLEACPDFLKALLRLKDLPKPHYDAQQWDVLQALFTLLPLLAAHLHVVFNENNEVDFTAISEQALLSLGEEDAPTDLALYLDHAIHHLLVDEFQDTSIQQFELLGKLVQNWQPDEGKTLFVVGDPMQSIYRFRAAEVGLFLRARQQGIGPISLIPLELSSNFRSSVTIVDWVNQHFKSIFPQTDDIESGAVSFHRSDYIHTLTEDSWVNAYQCQGHKQEALMLLKTIKEELEKYPADEIAILVRSRGQLTHIVELLREENIPFQGVEIDHLAHLPHLRDVWSLTQVLLMPGNRLAWLSLLRSPWCGLTLSDLHAIATFAKNRSIYYALSQLVQITALSPEGRLRAAFVYQTLHNAFIQRSQEALVPWIINTLENLHKDSVLTTAEQSDLEQYWQLLGRFEQDGQLTDLELFQVEFNKLYSQRVTPSRLQIMTIHKSKGLEFECVILPGLGNKASTMDRPLFRWLKLPSQSQNDLLLLSPIKAAHQEQCLLYDYLGKLDAQKNSYELQRLLYVAVTRAKKRLYLFDNHEKISQGTFRHLLEKQAFISIESDDHLDELHALPTLYHLPIEFYTKENDTPIAKQDNPVILSTSLPRLIGIVAHELLQWICDHHPPSLPAIPWEIAAYQLKAMGFTHHALEDAKTQIKTQITAFYNDPIGQWLMKAHEEEHNEYELLVHEPHGVVTKIIDRTFVEQGMRWIIDFKTGSEDKNTTLKHQKQVNDYARLFIDENASPIRCGIYYLQNNHWVTWEYIPKILEDLRVC